MSTTVLKPVISAPAPAAAGMSWAGVRRQLAEWHARARQRRQLAELPPHRLEDLGLSADAARVEAAKPFWRA